VGIDHLVLHEPVVLQVLQEGVQRARLDVDAAARALGQALGDGVAVDGRAGRCDDVQRQQREYAALHLRAHDLDVLLLRHDRHHVPRSVYRGSI